MKAFWSILGSAFVLVAACSPEPPKPPNIVWVVWDTTRADHMSLYGYSKKTTPFLDEWAKSARVYDDCTSASSWTVPSHASMFTGLLPAEHGAQHGHEFLDDNLTTLAELLKEHGYDTFSWTANPHLSDEENFLQGFDVRGHPWDEDQRARALEILDRKLGDHAPKELVSRQERNASSPWILKATGELGRESWLAWLEKRDAQRPFFAFFNYMEAHRPLIPPRQFRERVMAPADVEASYATELEIDWPQTWSYCFGLEELDPRKLELLAGTYDAAVLELDTLFGELMGSLKERGLEGDTVVILTSDHGEHLGDHHLLDHQYSLSQTLIHVPLVVRIPSGSAPRGFVAGRDTRPVMSMDLFPTLLALAGVDAPRAGAGFARSLFDAQNARRRLADYSMPFPKPLVSMHKEHPTHDVARFERGQFVLLDGSWKLVQELDGPSRLYDLEHDPGELEDVSAQHADVCQRLKKALGSAVSSLKPLGSSDGNPRELSPELLRMLHELGY